MGLCRASHRSPLGGPSAWEPNPGLGSWASEPTRCRLPALPVPRNQVGKPQGTRSPRLGGAEGRVPGARSVCSAFQAVGGGEIWPPHGPCNRQDTSSGSPERLSALSVGPERAQPSLSLPHPRTGQGPETPVATGGRGGIWRNQSPTWTPAPHSAGFAGVESMGHPAGLRCGYTGPSAALGLPRNQTELRLLQGVCSPRTGIRYPLLPAPCPSLPWNLLPQRLPSPFLLFSLGHPRASAALVFIACVWATWGAPPPTHGVLTVWQVWWAGITGQAALVHWLRSLLCDIYLGGW